MYPNIEELTLSILKKLEVTQIPIPIKLVAEKWGLQIRPYDLGANVSGVLFLRSGLGIIGYNPSEPPVRQRFTIAHELGHYELHRNQGELFVDKTDQAQKVYLRNEASSSGELKQEREANAFAAAILMPKAMVYAQLREHQFDLNDEKALKDLAKLFQVSLPAITYRLSNLGLF
jgi:Zn-dependent peptidase ImmA (M78 family)